MKVSLIVLIVEFCFSSSYQQAQQDASYQQLFNTSMADCLKENNVDMGIVVNVWTQPDFPANNKPLQCFYNCLNIKMGITDDAGNINDGQLTKVYAHYDNSTVVSKISDDCKSMKPSEDMCEFGYLLTKCVAEDQLN